MLYDSKPVCTKRTYVCTMPTYLMYRQLGLGGMGRGR